MDKLSGLSCFPVLATRPRVAYALSFSTFLCYSFIMV